MSFQGYYFRVDAVLLHNFPQILVAKKKSGKIQVCRDDAVTSTLPIAWLLLLGGFAFERFAGQPFPRLALIVRGKNVVVMVNGTKTAEARVDGLPVRGPIFLNADAPGTVIHFRKIEIKELPPED